MSCPCPHGLLLVVCGDWLPRGCADGEGTCLSWTQTLSPLQKQLVLPNRAADLWICNCTITCAAHRCGAHGKDTAKWTESHLGYLWNCILILQLEAVCCHYSYTHIRAWGISTETHASITFNDTVEKGDWVMVSKSVGSFLTSNTTYSVSLCYHRYKRNTLSQRLRKMGALPIQLPVQAGLDKTFWMGIFFLCIFLKSIMRTENHLSRAFTGCMDTENRHSSRSLILLL